jgi:predicted transcriptional regulator
MKKATIRIRRDTQTAVKEMGKRFLKAWKTGKSDGDLLQFESPAALFRVLTAKRWELIERLQTTGPTTLRAGARVGPRCETSARRCEHLDEARPGGMYGGPQYLRALRCNSR